MPLNTPPSKSPRVVPLLIAALAGTLVLVTTAGVAGAHTELLQASPGPGQRAGGDIDFVDLAFLESVTGVAMEVSRDGETVPGSMEVSDGSIVRFKFDEPLTEAGTYDVTYRFVSFDGDNTDGTFFFNFDPDAPQAQRLGNVEAEESGRNWLRLIAGGVLAISLVGLAFMFLLRLEEKRRSAASTKS